MDIQPKLGGAVKIRYTKNGKRHAGTLLSVTLDTVGHIVASNHESY